MRTFFLAVRVLLTRFFFFIIGLHIDYWRKKVEFLWSVDDKKLEQYMEGCLRRIRPEDADGIVIESLQALSTAKPVSKTRLREQIKDQIPRGSKFHRHTAGSSGEPAEIRLNRNELGRMLGVRDYCYRHCGIRLGDREARLWGRPEKNLKADLKNFLLNRRIFHPVGDQLTDEIESLIRWQPTYIYGYASIIMECAGELDRTGQEVPGLQCVICTAETILPAQKAYLRKVFNSPVFEEYGATEFDIMAFDCRRGHRHVVNPWLVFETGSDDQCLVTDVLRSSQSLVRYQLGDVLEFSHDPCKILGSHVVLDEIKGRTIDRFAFIDKKTWFHAVAFSHAIDRYQRQTKEFFRFTIYQVGYSEFELFCDPQPISGTGSVATFVERELAESTGYNILVRGIQTEESYNPVKRSYFVQSM